MCKIFVSWFLLTSFLLLVDNTIDAVSLSCSGTNKHTAKATGYFPATSEGGFVDCMGNSLKTLQQFVAGQADYVSVSMDQNLRIQYGTHLCIPELNAKYKKQIQFRVVDTGPAFTGKGYSRIDICVDNEHDSFDDSVNGQLTLYFTNLKTGSPSCG